MSVKETKKDTLENLFNGEVLRWRYGKAVLMSYILHYVLCCVVCNIFRIIVADGLLNPLLWLGRLVLIGRHPFHYLLDHCIPILFYMALIRIQIASYNVHPWVPTRRIDYLIHFCQPFVMIKILLLTFTCGFFTWHYASLAHPSYATFFYACKGEACINQSALIIVLSGLLFGLQFSMIYFGQNLNVLLFPPARSSSVLSLKLKMTWRFVRSSCSSFNVGMGLILMSPIAYISLGILYHNCLGNLMGLKEGSLSTCMSLFSPLTEPTLWMLLILGSVLLAVTLNGFLTLFDEIVTEPIELNIGVDEVFNNSGDRDTGIWTLSNGLGSKAPLLRLLSFRHLKDISSDGSEWGAGYRRKAFAISQPGGHPRNWQGILKPSLSLIKEFTHNLKGVNKSGELGVKREMPSNVIQSPAEIRLLAVKKKLKESMQSLFSVPLVKFFISPLPEAESRKVMSDGQAAIWAVQGLAHLVAASYTNDGYGVVQRDASDILTSLVQLQQAVEQSVRISSARLTSCHQTLLDARLRMGLRNSIRMALYTITDRYKEAIRDLSLTEEVQTKMNSYLAFHEG